MDPKKNDAKPDNLKYYSGLNFNGKVVDIAGNDLTEIVNTNKKLETIQDNNFNKLLNVIFTNDEIINN